MNLGLRYEYYPLMSRADRGLEQLDYNTFNVQLGGLGGNPKDLGIKVDKALFAPRLGARLPHQRGHGVPRRLRQDVQPAAVVAADARLLSRDDRLQRRRRRTASSRTAPSPHGIPGAPNPDIASGNVPLPRGVDMRSPDPDDVKRGTIDSWNVFVERRLPLDMSRQRRLRRHAHQRRLRRHAT